MSKRIVLGLLATVLCSSVNADPSVGLRFRPKDECIHVKGYFEFRRSFEDLVRKRDGQALFAMIASDVVLEIGGLSGKENFAKKWNLAAGEASPIWSELDKIIRLGCFAESDRGLMMPHMTALDPHWSADRVSPKALVLGEYILHMVSLSNEGPLYHVGQEFTSARMSRREKLNVEEAASRAPCAPEISSGQLAACQVQT